MQRTYINPWKYGEAYSFNQADLVEGAQRVLYCAGQASVDDQGTPLHIGDMAGQLAKAIDNLEAVLQAAGMNLGSLVRLNIYTTDVDELLRHYAVLSARLGAAKVAPPGTLLGVARLGMPEVMVEIEGTAVG